MAALRAVEGTHDYLCLRLVMPCDDIRAKEAHDARAIYDDDLGRKWLVAHAAAGRAPLGTLV